MTNNAHTLSRPAQGAIIKYSEAVCRKAYAMHREGYGASGVANECPGFPDIRRGSVAAADSAINAGRELAAVAGDAEALSELAAIQRNKELTAAGY